MALPDPTAQPQQPGAQPSASLPLLGLLGHPGGAAASEAQLRTMREYAAALMAESMKQPDLKNPYAYHYTQGIGHVVQALMGGYQQGQADRLEREARAEATKAAIPSFSAPATTTFGGTPGARADTSVSPGPSVRTADLDDTEVLSPRQIAQQDQLRVFTGPAAETGSGPAMTSPGRFTDVPSTPERQQGLAMLAQAMGGDQDNAPAHMSKLAFSGEPLPPGATPRMPGVALPGSNPLPEGEVPQPIPGAPTLPPDAQATVRALAAVGPTGGAPDTAAPAPAGPQFAQATSPAMPGGAPIHGTFVPPEAFPRRTQYTPQQLAAVMNNPFADPALKAQVWQLYQQQQQPLSMPYKGVGTIIANPQNPSQQSFIPEIRMFKEKTGSIEREVPYSYDIRADRWAPVAMGVAGGAPPAAGAPPASGQAAGASAPTAGRAPFTGNAPGPLLQDLQDLDVEKKRREDQAGADVKRYSSLHEGLTGAGDTAAESLYLTKIGRGVLEDPKFYSGSAADAILALRKAGIAVGMLEGNEATPMQVFNKVMSANILQQLNSLKAEQLAMGQQGGRIFQSQIELMEKAAANLANTPETNRYLLELSEWSANRSKKIADMADDYKIAHGSLDAGFNKALRHAVVNDPEMQLPRNLAFPNAAPAAAPGAPTGALIGNTTIAPSPTLPLGFVPDKK